MPVLAVGADKSFGTAQADVLRFVASDVTGQVIANSGHWLMEEQPAACQYSSRTLTLVFLSSGRRRGTKVH
jgi:pimeloyl-ACP methyl ester carboxylesterase